MRHNLMSILAKLYERVPYTVKKDRLDDLFYSRHKDKITEKVKEIVDELLPQIPPLTKDTFNVFYKPNPSFYDDSEIAPEYLVNKRVLEKVMKTAPFQELKETTVLDDMNSAIATVVFMEAIYGELKKKLAEIEEKNKKIQELRSRLEQVAKSKENNPDAQKEVEGIVSEIERTAQDLQKVVSQGAVSVAVRKAKDRYDEVVEALQSFSFGNQPGKIAYMDPETAVNLALEVSRNPHIKKMVELLGRMRNLLRSTEKTTPKPSRMELHRVTMDRDIERLIPTELVKLRKYKAVFYKDYYEGKLLSYELKTREKENKGPIVIALDLSGSMAGLREQWAKAVGLATIDLATKERRAWGIIGFNAEIVYSNVFKKPPSPQEVLEVMSLRANGGTNYELPLAKAMEMLEEFNGKADILFISDGECKVNKGFLKQFNEFRKRKGVAVYSVLIEGDATVMKSFSDRVLELRGRLDNQSAEAVFRWLV